jgi:serine phosphatase RsbU (regulator of sigma subunit)
VRLHHARDRVALRLGQIERAQREPDDRLYCYTDGAIETLNAADEEFGLDRLLAEIDRWRGLPLRAGLDRVAAAVRA